MFVVTFLVGIRDLTWESEFSFLVRKLRKCLSVLGEAHTKTGDVIQFIKRNSCTLECSTTCSGTSVLHVAIRDELLVWRWCSGGL
jgi:hypothetical protein